MYKLSVFLDFSKFLAALELSFLTFVWVITIPSMGLPENKISTRRLQRNYLEIMSNTLFKTIVKKSSIVLTVKSKTNLPFTLMSIKKSIC